MTFLPNASVQQIAELLIKQYSSNKAFLIDLDGFSWVGANYWLIKLTEAERDELLELTALEIQFGTGNLLEKVQKYGAVESDAVFYEMACRNCAEEEGLRVFGCDGSGGSDGGSNREFYAAYAEAVTTLFDGLVLKPHRTHLPNPAFGRAGSIKRTNDPEYVYRALMLAYQGGEFVGAVAPIDVTSDFLETDYLLKSKAKLKRGKARKVQSDTSDDLTGDAVTTPKPRKSATKASSANIEYIIPTGEEATAYVTSLGNKFTFIRKGIPLGTELQSISETPQIATVTGERTVALQGSSESLSLSAATKAVKGEGSYRGAEHWSYNGVRLLDLADIGNQTHLAESEG